MAKIIQTGHKTLRETAQDVPPEEIKSEKIKKLLADMAKTLSATPDGVALAAPQINIPLRIFIVLKEFYDIKPEEIEKQKEETSDKKSEKEKNTIKPVVVFINPKITKLSKKKQIVREGCLSVAGIFGTIARAEKAAVEAINENGQKFSRGASGLLAQIFQHEMDHLNGVLFTDFATNLEKIENPEKI
ncbi:MAG: peptide deformylase [Candidatus Pacebacteria bacterium]|nr:peptide deformylase [Candidatus Paceibacterota bacterium]